MSFSTSLLHRCCRQSYALGKLNKKLFMRRTPLRMVGDVNAFVGFGHYERGSEALSGLPRQVSV
jgi:hypothetical protein